MHVILDQFLDIHVSKKPLDAYLVRELIKWGAEKPIFKITHPYLYKKTRTGSQKSCDPAKVQQHIFKTKKIAISQANATNCGCFCCI